MMSIESISSNDGNSPSDTQINSLGKDDFLKMLVAQLQNQDPLNPLDGTDFTAQLAQFTSLEQQAAMNNQLEMIGLYQSSLNNAQSVNLVGRQITANGSIVKAEGPSTGIDYDLSGNADTVTIRIYDQEGILVDTLKAANKVQGQNSIMWDSSSAADGNYSLEISAVDSNGDAVLASTIVKGTVTGVTFKNGAPCLLVNGGEISFGDIISVHESAA